MAHNYYRIPLRIRWKSLHDMKNSEAETLERSRCRRHRRKLRYLLHLYELRMKAGGRWMETHIWHAKRVKMEDATAKEKQVLVAANAIKSSKGRRAPQLLRLDLSKCMFEKFASIIGKI